ncbi:MAG: DNA-binding protein WhiA [Suipraeoptans sp.]
MSFSSEVKGELVKNNAKARHCSLAELQALLTFSGYIVKECDDRYTIVYKSENIKIATKCFTLLRKTFNIKTDVMVRRNSANYLQTYLLSAVGSEFEAIKNASLQSACCKRAYIRGAFLAAGSISDPGKSYHFEVVCNDEMQAEHLRNIINSFDVSAKIVKRKKHYVVYLKEGSQIVEILNIMEAHIALMELENVRIFKDVRNSVNRRVNCEAANINKTVSASVRQVEDISLIKDKMGIDKLPENLQDIAHVRLENPDAPLKELGQLLEVPIGKSGVNHRLRKLGEIAALLREKLGG